MDNQKNVGCWGWIIGIVIVLGIFGSIGNWIQGNNSSSSSSSDSSSSSSSGSSSSSSSDSSTSSNSPSNPANDLRALMGQMKDPFNKLFIDVSAIQNLALQDGQNPNLIDTPDYQQQAQNLCNDMETQIAILQAISEPTDPQLQDWYTQTEDGISADKYVADNFYNDVINHNAQDIYTITDKLKEANADYGQAVQDGNSILGTN